MKKKFPMVKGGGVFKAQFHVFLTKIIFITSGAGKKITLLGEEHERLSGICWRTHIIKNSFQGVWIFFHFPSSGRGGSEQRWEISFFLTFSLAKLWSDISKLCQYVSRYGLIYLSYVHICQNMLTKVSWDVMKTPKAKKISDSQKSPKKSNYLKSPRLYQRFQTIAQQISQQKPNISKNFLGFEIY